MRGLASNDTSALSIVDQKLTTFDARIDGSTMNGCECDMRLADEEEKENMMAEIHLTYEEILQLE